jgi:hypothetical protein
MPRPFKDRRAGAQSTRLASSSFPAASPAPAHRQIFLLRIGWLLCAFSAAAIFLVGSINAANSEPIVGKHSEGVTTAADIAVLVEKPHAGLQSRRAGFALSCRLKVVVTRTPCQRRAPWA